MKQEQVLDREQERAQLVLEPQADDAGASDLLDIIERGSNAARSKPKGKETRRTQVAAREEPIPLELVYFRSFGQRPLLTKIEEVALAKRIDAGTRGVRRALLDAVHLAARMRKSEVVIEALSTLDEVRTLSGLSATALNLAESTLKDLAREAGGSSKIGALRRKQLRNCLHQAQAARVLLESAKDEMVRCNLRLVVDIAKRYYGRGLGLLDLIQEGNIGLMKAAERYEYRKGFKFSTYATWWVRQGITRALADQSRTIRIPVHLTEASHRITRTTRRLGQQLGYVPRAEEVAKALKVRPEKIHETMQAFQEPISTEHPVGDGDTSLGELIPDRDVVPPDVSVHRTERDREVGRILSNLTPREQLVIRLRFGIGQSEPRTLEQVGQNLLVTRERIRQIEAKALKKLRNSQVQKIFSGIMYGIA